MLKVEGMSVVQARIQTVEDIYRLIGTSVASKKPLEAIYDKRLRLFCPHRLAGIARENFGCCAINVAEKSKSGLEARGSPANGVVWRSRSSAG